MKWYYYTIIILLYNIILYNNRYLLGDMHFLEKLVDFNVLNNVEHRFIKLRNTYLSRDDFTKENIIKNSEAAANIFDWIKAIDVY